MIYFIVITLILYLRLKTNELFGEIHSEPIRFIPIHSEICIRANPNSSDSIRRKFSISFDVNRLKINPSQSESIRDF